MSFHKKLYEVPLTFEAWDIDHALKEITILKEKAPQDSKAFEFYSTIENMLFSQRTYIEKCESLTKWNELLTRRIDVLEKLFMYYTKSDTITTHDIIDLIRDTKH